MSTGARRALARGLGTSSLLAVVFFNVSGGPYGVEDAVPALGPGLCLLLLVLTPLVWSLPVALAMAELGSALPDEGGYVSWVTRAFGPFWGFQVGWWSWLNSFVDVAVYPALFADYLLAWWPGMTGLQRWMVVLAMIWGLTGLNLAGVRLVGRTAVVLALCALAPVVAFTAVAAAQITHAPWVPFAAQGSGGLLSGLGLGLAVTMWNYSGWDAPSTVLGETRHPETAYRRALFWSLPLISLAYVLPMGAALGALGDWAEWKTGHFPQLGAALGGPLLAGALTAGALLATAGQFLTALLTNSRLPYAMAQSGWLPAGLATLRGAHGTPVLAIVVSSAVYSVCAAWSFKELIVLNVWLYSLTLILELAAFAALRVREPALPRPWRVGGGAAGLWLTTALPITLSLLAMATAGWIDSAVGVAAALTGPAAWALSGRARAAA